MRTLVLATVILSGWGMWGYKVYTSQQTVTATTVIQAADPECALWRLEQKMRLLPPLPDAPAYVPQGRILGLSEAR